MAARTHVLLLLGPLVVAATGCTVGRTETPEWAKRQLATLEGDPMVALRPPGTEFKTQGGRPAGSKKGLKWDDYWSTTLSVSFTMSGEPGAAVEAYLAAAPGVGWRLFEVHCQRQALEVTAVFGKEIQGFPGGSDVLLTVVARPQSHELGVDLDTNHAPPEPPRPSSAGLPRRDVHCLRGVDPADPRRRPRSAVPARSPEELCALVSPEEAQAFFPEVAGAQPLRIDARARCRFSEGSLGGQWFDILDAATIPLAAFEDRQYSLAGADAGFFLLVADVHISDTLWGAWIDSPRGPLELSTGPHYTEEAVTGLGRLIQLAALSR